MENGWLSSRFWVVLFSGEPGLVSECFRVAELFAHLRAKIEDMGEEHKRYKRTLEIQYPVDMLCHFMHIDIHCIYYFSGHRVTNPICTLGISMEHRMFPSITSSVGSRLQKLIRPIEWAKDLPKRADPNHRRCGSHLKSRAIWFINVYKSLSSQ